VFVDFQDVRVAVTGAGSGIGEAIAVDLAARGADVAVLEIDPAKARAVADRVAAHGVTGVPVAVDVASFEAVHAAFGEVFEALGRVDVLVNNAGVADYTPFWELTEQAWDRMIGVHLKGTFNCTSAVIPGMRERRYGRIINMASVAGLTGTPTHAHYSAAKGGLIGLTKALAKEVGDCGITVNAIAPGFIDTAITQSPGFPKELVEAALERIPVKGGGTVEDVAYVTAFLAAEQARFITGQVISPNGGYVI
jgi:NAD(P)-dependent dehydrogenase (short-subunit alcohol dehydrogenase family)